MRRYTKVSPKFWTSPTVRSLSEDGRWLFLYLITCPHNNLLGLFAAPLGYLTADLRWSEERVRAALEELVKVPKAGGEGSREKGVISWDPQTELIFIHDQLRHEGLANKNVVKAALKLLESLPTSEKLFSRLLGAIEDLGKEYAAPLEAAIRNRLGKGLPNPLGNGLPNGLANGLGNPLGNGLPNGLGNRLGKGLPNGLGIQEQEQEQDPPPIIPPHGKVVSLEVHKGQERGQEGKKGRTRSRASPKRSAGRRERRRMTPGKESKYAKFDR